MAAVATEPFRTLRLGRLRQLSRREGWFGRQSGRSIATFNAAMRNMQWPLVRAEMVQFFREHLHGPSKHFGHTCEQRHDQIEKGCVEANNRSSTVSLDCRPWDKFISSSQIEESGCVPCAVTGRGCYRRIAIAREKLQSLAFDEEDGHLSLLFTARLFRLRIGSIIEECVVKYAKADPLVRHLQFVQFERHLPGEVTEVSIPLTLVGLLACPAYHQGYHVELAKPSIKVQFVGLEPPPPFLVDVSELKYAPPYRPIFLKSLQSVQTILGTAASSKEQLPKDGSARFHPSYNLNTEEIAWTYEVGTLPEAPLPPDWQDPNFRDRRGNMMDVWYHRRFPRSS